MKEAVLDKVLSTRVQNKPKNTYNVVLTFKINYGTEICFSSKINAVNIFNWLLHFISRYNNTVGKMNGITKIVLFNPWSGVLTSLFHR